VKCQFEFIDNAMRSSHSAPPTAANIFRGKFMKHLSIDSLNGVIFDAFVI